MKTLDLSKNPLEAPDLIHTPGVTSNLHRQAFVIGDNIDTAIAEILICSYSLPSVSRSLYAEQIAVHELVHLASVPDTVYFKLTHRPDGNLSVMNTVPPGGLRSIDGGDKGNFFEEGFATLCGHMYLWSHIEGIVEDARTDLRQSPDGVTVNLPIRHVFAAGPYSYASWAIERLNEMSPDIWDIFIDSRRYGASPEETRVDLKAQLDKFHPKLFDVVDHSDPHNLNSALRTAAIVDRIALHVT